MAKVYHYPVTYTAGIPKELLDSEQPIDKTVLLPKNETLGQNNILSINRSNQIEQFNTSHSSAFPSNFDSYSQSRSTEKLGNHSLNETVKGHSPDLSKNRKNSYGKKGNKEKGSSKDKDNILISSPTNFRKGIHVTYRDGMFVGLPLADLPKEMSDIKTVGSEPEDIPEILRLSPRKEKDEESSSASNSPRKEDKTKSQSKKDFVSIGSPVHFRKGVHVSYRFSSGVFHGFPAEALDYLNGTLKAKVSPYTTDSSHLPSVLQISPRSRSNATTEMPVTSELKINKDQSDSNVNNHQNPEPPVVLMGSLSGEISTDNGTPMRGAKVTLVECLNKTSYTTTTEGEKGFYCFKELPCGKYEMFVEADGFQMESLRVEITPDLESTSPRFGGGHRVNQDQN